MNPYLAVPIKTKEIVSGENKKYVYSSVSMQGWRTGMEDAHIQSLDFDGDDKAIFGVFDGHGGKEMAVFVANIFISELIKLPEYKQGNYKAALEQNFLKMDELGLAETQKENSLGVGFPGCTANVTLIVNKMIYCANSGDSRTIIMQGKQSFALSIDHKPDMFAERTRIEKAGGTVVQGRVNWNLNLSRALGDFEYKVNEANPNNKNPREFIITAFPEVTQTPLAPDVSVIILGCDGIWECKSNQFIGEFFYKAPSTQQGLTAACEGFLDANIATNTLKTWGLDNMSLIVVKVIDQNKK